MSKIQVWLSKGSDRFRFPVNPESFDVSNEFDYQDDTISNIGEITRFGNRKQISVNFSSFFPKHYNPSFCEYLTIPNPYKAVDILRDWMQSKSVLQLTIIGSDVKIPVTIRSFKYSEKGGEVGDVYFDIEFKEYRKISPRIYDPTKKKTTTPRPSSKTIPKTYTVKKGDTLYSIAKQFYGNAEMWRKIYELNKSKIGKNPNLLVVGMVLVLPDGSSSSLSNPSSSSSKVTFTVRSGDTVYEIAAAYSNCSVSDIMRLNPKISPSNLKVGQVLILPSNSKKLRDPRRLNYTKSVNKPSTPVSKPAPVTTTPKPGTVEYIEWIRKQRHWENIREKLFPSN